ncbi:kappa-type opioid receptor-like [Acropora palmata]|uniref:kappa-type opioid receptor-like n=1 Tax=Acropora palmata TaxID=6131 RepID=UPI003DA0C2B9
MDGNHSNNEQCRIGIGFEGEILASICHSCLAFAGSLGNVFLIFVIFRTPSLKTVCGLLISNVAVTDLVVTSVVMPVLVFVLIQGFFPPCLFALPMLIVILVAYFSVSASLLTLTKLSMDRCFAICYPLKHKMWVTVTTVKILIVETWIISLCLPLLEMLYQGPPLVPNSLQTLAVGVCYTTIIISGVFTVIKVRRSSLGISSFHDDQGRGNMAVGLNLRNKQVAKTIAWVVLLFSLCWLPIAVVISFDDSRRNHSSLYFWFATLGFANSSVNTWIYFYRQANYRRALKLLLGYKANKTTPMQRKPVAQETKSTDLNDNEQKENPKISQK